MVVASFLIEINLVAMRLRLRARMRGNYSNKCTLASGMTIVQTYSNHMNSEIAKKNLNPALQFLDSFC
jgi:hypothetical protein